MNPEEGNLRPQILDRFGLRVVVHGLEDVEERLEAYRRVQSYLVNPRQTVAAYSPETVILQDEIQVARANLEEVVLPDEIANLGLDFIKHLKIDSLRAEITLFEAARAYAAADARQEVTSNDLREVALLALRGRRSRFMVDYFETQQDEEGEIENLMDQILDPEPNTGKSEENKD
jgi:magnesium chelatase subunit I